MDQLTKQIETQNNLALKQMQEIIDLITEINKQIEKDIKQSTTRGK
jgi:hypothetical protein